MSSTRRPKKHSPPSTRGRKRVRKGTKNLRKKGKVSERDSVEALDQMAEGAMGDTPI